MAPSSIDAPVSDNRSGGIRIERPDVGSVVVVLTGEHDLTTKGALEACLGSAVNGNDLVVADLSEAMFIDSTTMHVLLTTHRAARKQGGAFRLQVGTAAVVERALELSGLLQELEHAATREEALRNGRPSVPQPTA